MFMASNKNARQIHEVQIANKSNIQISGNNNKSKLHSQKSKEHKSRNTYYHSDHNHLSSCLPPKSLQLKCIKL